MERSSGVILFRKVDGRYEFFVCTPDGPYWEHRELWNFPKGHVERGETDFEAALREFKEETSITLNKRTHYIDFGMVKQNPKKMVHVYGKKWKGEDTSNCSSNMTSTYYNGHKIRHHEIKAYAWKTLEELETNGMKCYLPIFREIIENDYYCQGC